MKSIKPTILITILLISKLSYSQIEFPAFGAFSTEEINMKQCSFDPEADAIILLDKAVVNYDDDHRLIMEIRVRIKILNEKGLEHANIILPFYHKDEIEYISKTEAYTFNFDASGRPSNTPVDKKSIHIERTTNYYSQVKFAMPAVKPGSIIEYHYVITRKHYGYLDEWQFQSKMPTVNSSFLLFMLPTHEFTYTVQKSPHYEIKIQPTPNEGKIYFEMNNVAGLRIEPYMDAADDYLQKVMFQHSAYLSSYGSKQKVNTTWKDLAYELITDKSFGSQLDKDLKIEEVKNIVTGEPTATGKLRAIYEYVKRNITWNGIKGKMATDGLKAVVDKKKGSAGEMNLLLVNLLTFAGIEAYPILAAERDYGKVDTTYPYFDRFNKTVALAIAEGKQYVLDASQYNCPLGLTPYPLLGTVAFIVDKKKFNLIRIAPGNKFFKNIITVNASLDSKGLLSGEAKVLSYDYARQLRMNAVKNDKKKFINDNFEKLYDGLTVDSFHVTTPEHDSIPFGQFVKFKQQLNESGGYTLMNPNLFSNYVKNPFISSIRFTNMNFGFPYNIVMEATIKLPPGTKIDVPEDKTIRSDDKSIEAFKQIRYENGEMKVLMRFIQTATLVRAENYPAIKDFYKKMVDMLNESVVLKLSN